VKLKPLVLTFLAAALTLVFVAGATAQARKVVLTVGLTQDLDSPNVTVGFLVSDYELWNLQYTTLTDKAADDFETIPSLAESWEGSDDGLTWTYTLREGLKWSDGEPLTAEDIAYTINRSREEEWLNHSATVVNITAEATDDRTVVLTSSEPDPKLPTMDVYIVPKHVYEKISAKELRKYPARDGVGSGPFTLTEWQKGQFWRMEANPNYWGGKPAIDEVVFRVFRNPAAMVAALRKGEIDAAHDVPSQAFKQLENVEGIEAVQGQQGGFDELALNAGDAYGKPHPAIMDLRVRQAIAHSIDKETIVERVLAGLGTPATTMSPSANPDWIPELTEDEDYEFDLEKANGILDDAGYMDTNGDGVREMPGGGNELRFRYAIRTESDIAAPIAEFVSGWLDEIGIATRIKGYDDSQLTEVIGKGEYEMFVWGWTPFVDPDPMLSYMTCDMLSLDPEDPTNYYNDASWCDREYDQLYQEQKVELDPERRQEIVHEMLKLFYASAAYIVLEYSPDLQAYRTDRFTGWTRQPAEIGPVIFSNTSPSYVKLAPIPAGGTAAGAGGAAGDDGLSTTALAAIIVGGVAAAGLAAFALTRRRTREERE
jgi:peptide/nickel transport system substrate-binding protein